MAIAYWRKCDFQVHSPRDPNWQGERPVGLGDEIGGACASSQDVEAARIKWATEFVEQCSKKGLEAVALTDHHEMVMVPYVQAAIESGRTTDSESKLWLFPGMELTCRNGVQCVIIFDADLSEDWRREAQSRLGIVFASLNEKARQGPPVTQLSHSYPELAGLLDEVSQLKGRYIILPNVSDGGRFSVVTNGAHADFRSMPYIGGYLDGGQTTDTLGSKTKRRLSGEEQVWGSRFIYPLPTSDSRDASYAKLGSNQCWIKLAAPTAEAIRQAFLGHRSRISIEYPNISSLRVKSLTVSGSLIVADGEHAISPELNSFIGGRGSGKSTLLEYIAFGLGRSCADIDKPDYSGRDRLKGLINDTLISAGGTLDLAIEQDGATFYIRRGGATSYVPKIIYPDGSSQEIPARELRSLFPAVVYSQGELSEIGKQAGKRAQLSELLQFVQPEFKREDERLNAAIDDGKLSVRKAVQALSAAWTQQANIQKLQTAKSSLEQRLAALQKTLPQLPPSDQQIIARFDALVDLDAKRQQAERQAQSVMDDLSELWKTSRQPVDVASALTEATDLHSAYAAFTASFANGIEALGKELAAHRDKIVACGKPIQASLANAKISRDTALEKLTAHKSVTAQVTKLQEELQTLIAQIADLRGSSLSSDDRFADLQAAIKILQDAVKLRGAKTEEWASKIEALSSQRIKAQLNVDGNWSEIFDAVDILAAKTGSQESVRHQRINDKLEVEGAWALLDALRADSLAALRWKQISQSSSGDRPSCDTLFGVIGGTERTSTSCMDLIDLQRVEAIATAVPKPDITLYYCDGDRKISFEKASEGQRAAALLFMLLEQPGGPLIIDQPEGDLDNKIVSELAEKLHSAKQHRQIIFASHNANIVVNGSSELVVCMDVTSDAKRDVACSGAIDQQDVCLTITETMEGGEKAFRDRKDKYGY